MIYWRIFWRTFAQLTLAALLAIQVPDLVDKTWVTNTAEAVGLTLIGALIGGVVAALWAFVASPASTALQKAWRSAAQAVAATLGGIVVTQVSDLLTLPTVLIGGLISVVLAFLITFFQNQGSLTGDTVTPIAP